MQDEIVARHVEPQTLVVCFGVLLSRQGLQWKSAAKRRTQLSPSLTFSDRFSSSEES